MLKWKYECISLQINLLSKTQILKTQILYTSLQKCTESWFPFLQLCVLLGKSETLVFGDFVLFFLEKPHKLFQAAYSNSAQELWRSVAVALSFCSITQCGLATSKPLPFHK